MKKPNSWPILSHGIRLWCGCSIALLIACTEDVPKVLPPVAQTVVEETVGSSGGIIEVDDETSAAFGVKLEIPSGSLSGDTSIAIEHCKENAPSYEPNSDSFVMKTGGPAIRIRSDKDFIGPVTLHIPYKDEDQDGIVDGTDFPESGLGLNFFNNSGHWSALPLDENGLFDDISIRINTTEDMLVAVLKQTLANAGLYEQPTAFRFAPGIHKYHVKSVPDSIDTASANTAIAQAITWWDNLITDVDFEIADAESEAEIVFQYGKRTLYGSKDDSKKVATCFYPTWNRSHTVILLNSSYEPGFCLKKGGNCREMRSSIAHEFGHALGIRTHISETDLGPPVMHGQSCTGQGVPYLFPEDIALLNQQNYAVAAFNKPVVQMPYNGCDTSASTSGLSQDKNGNYTVVFFVADADSLTCAIEFEYQIEGQTDWLPITFSSVSDGIIDSENPNRITNLPTSEEGIAHSFDWDPQTDIPGLDVDVMLRATPTDEDGTGIADTSQSFYIPKPAFSAKYNETFDSQGTWTDDEYIYLDETNSRLYWETDDQHRAAEDMFSSQTEIGDVVEFEYKYIGHNDSNTRQDVLWGFTDSLPRENVMPENFVGGVAQNYWSQSQTHVRIQKAGTSVFDWVDYHDQDEEVLFNVKIEIISSTALKVVILKNGTEVYNVTREGDATGITVDRCAVWNKKTQSHPIQGTYNGQLNYIFWESQ